MAFLRSVTVKRQGRTSKYVAIPLEWEFKAGDWVLLKLHDIRTDVVLQATLRIRLRSNSNSQYVTIPCDWPVIEGDLVDIKVSYAGLPTSKEGE